MEHLKSTKGAELSETLPHICELRPLLLLALSFRGSLYKGVEGELIDSHQMTMIPATVMLVMMIVLITT